MKLKEMHFFQKILDDGWCDALPTCLMAGFWELSKNPNNLFKNEFKFRIFIEKKVFSYHLVKKYDFLDNKIIEIYNDE